MMSNEASAEIVIFDIDGTLADISARMHHILKKPKDWQAFFQDMCQDKVIWPMLKLCNTLYNAGFKIVICSGRPEKYRNDTEAWLKSNCIKYHELYLRADDDRRSDVIVKNEMLMRMDKARIAFVVEDRSRVVEMWRDEGLICLQCAPNEF
jgi:hypothetical protein